MAIQHIDNGETLNEWVSIPTNNKKLIEKVGKTFVENISQPKIAPHGVLKPEVLKPTFSYAEIYTSLTKLYALDKAKRSKNIDPFLKESALNPQKIS